MASLASTFTRISSAARTVAQPCRAILTPNQLGVFKMHQHGFPTFTKLKTIGATRAFQSSVSMAKNPRSSSWGDMIPSPHQSSSSSENPISKIILSRPQYKRFGQQGPNGSQNGRGRGPPIFYDKRFQVVGGVVTVGAGGYYVTHLETVPMTGRRRFMDVSIKQEEMMSREAYNQVIHQYHNKILPQNHVYTQYVKRVAERIIQAAGMQDLAWEFHVIASDEKNAFVLPGGKVFVFTGILPIAENEDGLATVLGHEIAHQLARHSAEKLSFTKIALFLGVIVSLVFDPSWSMQRIMMELGMMLPFSRKCETEADQIGLQLMAQACFDPRESTRMWARMHQTESGPSFSFLNTHPASKDRATKLEQWMPEAMNTWHTSDCATTNAYADMFSKFRHASW